MTPRVIPGSWALASEGNLFLVDVNPVQNGYHVSEVNVTIAPTTYNSDANWYTRTLMSPTLGHGDLIRTTGAVFHLKYTGPPLTAQGRLTVAFCAPWDEEIGMSTVVSTIANSPNGRVFSMTELMQGVSFPIRHSGDSSDLYVNQDRDLTTTTAPAGAVDDNSKMRRFGWQQLWFMAEGLASDAVFSWTIKIHKEVISTPGGTFASFASPPNHQDGKIIQLLQNASTTVGHIGHRLLEQLASGAYSTGQFVAGQLAGRMVNQATASLLDASPLLAIAA
jgi:hypothetical protein